MVLTAENYYSREADLEYMRCSQYEGFLECEAKQMAKLQGRFVDKPSEALIVGNYVHSYMESAEAHEQFVKEHFDDIFKTKKNKKGKVIITGKYAAYEKADEIIGTMENDATLMKFRNMDGEAEKILTGELFGIQWSIRMDKYIKNPRIILDWKTVADIHKLTYNHETKEFETFIESYGYMRRAAVYSEIERQYAGNSNNAMFLIAAISKQDPPGKGLFSLNHKDRYMYELDKIKEKLPRILQVKSFSADPVRCGRCDYCRSTAGNLQIKPYYILKPENWEGYETDGLARKMLADAQTA